MTVPAALLEQLARMKCETPEGTLKLSMYAASFMFDTSRRHNDVQVYRSVVVALIGCCRQILKDHPELDLAFTSVVDSLPRTVSDSLNGLDKQLLDSTPPNPPEEPVVQEVVG